MLTMLINDGGAADLVDPQGPLPRVPGKASGNCVSRYCINGVMVLLMMAVELIILIVSIGVFVIIRTRMHGTCE